MRARDGTRRHGLLMSVVLLLALGLSGCGANGSNTAKHPQETAAPAATATTDPAAPPPVATPGAPCSGGEWGKVIGTIGKDIALPPQTVRGTAENLDIEASGWDGQYISLCTGGTIDGINGFVDDHMTQSGWSYGPPPSTCTCSADNVWSRANDPRLVQFERHPAEHDGQVRWGVLCYRKGTFGC
jgi:hypothetical protein